MTVTVESQFDCTQRELVVDIATLIYEYLGYTAPSSEPLYFYRSQHPTEKALLAVAEEIYEMFVGDSVNYDDDEDEEEGEEDGQVF